MRSDITLLDIILLGSGLIAWTVVVFWTVIAIKDWFVKVNGYKAEIRHLNDQLYKTKESEQSRLDLVRESNNKRFGLINDRLEKLEGKKRK